MLIYLYLASVLILTTYGQIVLKMRANHIGQSASGGGYLISMLLDPYVWSGLGAAACAGLLWLAAIRQLDLSYAYPFVACTFVLVPVAAHFFLGEPLSMTKLAGAAIIVAGVAVSGLERG